jgi:PIN domain nuclease of toxin-antitoxin system
MNGQERNDAMLLDTCALLWLAEGGDNLSKEARDRIENAPVVYVSSISAFEIAIKCRSGKLKLPLPAAEWFQEVVNHHGLAVQTLEWEICIAAAELPPVHKDPCDRFIIAAAKIKHMPVVTSDASFAAYGIEVLS